MLKINDLTWNKYGWFTPVNAGVWKVPADHTLCCMETPPLIASRLSFALQRKQRVQYRPNRLTIY